MVKKVENSDNDAYVSTKKALKLLGISYPTFRKNFVDTGKIRYAGVRFKVKYYYRTDVEKMMLFSSSF